MAVDRIGRNAERWRPFANAHHASASAGWRPIPIFWPTTCSITAHARSKTTSCSACWNATSGNRPGGSRTWREVTALRRLATGEHLRNLVRPFMRRRPSMRRCASRYPPLTAAADFSSIKIVEESFRWHEWNREQATKHGCSPAEIESVVPHATQHTKQEARQGHDGQRIHGAAGC